MTPPASAGRIGILGGTFDPPHLGHLIVAADACEALRLDRLVFVPSAAPPHKRGRVSATAGQRLEMVRRSIRGDRRFEVDDVELRREGPSYTVDTLRSLRDRWPAAELFLILGMDQYRELHTWHRPQEVVRLARLAVVARGGARLEPDPRWPAVPVEVTRIDLSATQVRERLARGVPVRYFVPDAVREMIEEEGLYRTSSVIGRRSSVPPLTDDR